MTKKLTIIEYTHSDNFNKLLNNQNNLLLKGINELSKFLKKTENFFNKPLKIYYDKVYSMITDEYPESESIYNNFSDFQWNCFYDTYSSLLDINSNDGENYFINVKNYSDFNEIVELYETNDTIDIINLILNQNSQNKIPKVLIDNILNLDNIKSIIIDKFKNIEHTDNDWNLLLLKDGFSKYGEIINSSIIRFIKKYDKEVNDAIEGYNYLNSIYKNQVRAYRNYLKNLDVNMQIENNFLSKSEANMIALYTLVSLKNNTFKTLCIETDNNSFNVELPLTISDDAKIIETQSNNNEIKSKVVLITKPKRVIAEYKDVKNWKDYTFIVDVDSSRLSRAEILLNTKSITTDSYAAISEKAHVNITYYHKDHKDKKLEFDCGSISLKNDIIKTKIKVYK